MISSNFTKMPGLLKLITAIALFNGAFAVWMAMPGAVQFHDRTIPTEEWWRNGSGFLLSVPLLMLGVSGVLLLLRRRAARLLHITGWLVMAAVAYTLPLINGSVWPLSTLAGYLITTLGAALFTAWYFYWPCAAGNYFDRVQ